jgi:predicted dehydrogenase
VHCIDALRYVLGADVVSVSTLAQKDGISGRVEAIASLQMEMTGGIYANVTASARGLYRTVVEVTGSDGALVVENGLTVDRPVELTVRRGGELVETVTAENGDGYTRMLDSFARAFRGEGNFSATGVDAIRNMRALDAAYASWRSGRRETVV